MQSKGAAEYRWAQQKNAFQLYKQQTRSKWWGKKLSHSRFLVYETFKIAPIKLIGIPTFIFLSDG